MSNIKRATWDTEKAKALYDQNVPVPEIARQCGITKGQLMGFKRRHWPDRQIDLLNRNPNFSGSAVPKQPKPPPAGPKTLPPLPSLADPDE